jgi:hypothetical protein
MHSLRIAVATFVSSTLLIASCQRTETPPSTNGSPTNAAPVEPISTAQVPTPSSATDIAGTPAGTVMTPGYLETVGRMIYVWGWPLVNHYNRAVALADLPEPGRNGGVLPVAPPGPSAC